MVPIPTCQLETIQKGSIQVKENKNYSIKVNAPLQVIIVVQEIVHILWLDHPRSLVCYCIIIKNYSFSEGENHLQFMAIRKLSTSFLSI